MAILACLFIGSKGAQAISMRRHPDFVAAKRSLRGSAISRARSSALIAATIPPYSLAVTRCSSFMEVAEASGGGDRRSHRFARPHSVGSMEGMGSPP